MTWLRWLAALLLMTLAVPQSALLNAAPGSDSAADSLAEDPIDIDPAANEDELIAERLRDIFGAVSAFKNVEVEVDNGVVTLSGTVGKDGDISKAETTALRTEGVVLVQNDIERDLSVEKGLGIFDKLAEGISDLLDLLPLLLLAILVGLGISAIGYIIAKFDKLWRRVAPNAFLAGLIKTAIRFTFVIGGVLTALDILGATALLGAVLGGAGVIGLALGVAMRDTVENYVASLMLSLRQPFRAGDNVLIDDIGGRVIRLTSRATVLMTQDGNHLRVPNSTVFKGVIINYSRNPQRRFDFELGIDADDDPREAMKLGRKVLESLPFVLSDPASSGRVENVGDSNIIIRFLAWIDQTDADWNKSRSLAIAATKEALEDAGFALPEPIYRLRFDGRSDPLPIDNVAQAEGSAARAPAKARKARTRDAEDDDVRPESNIDEMIDKERSSEESKSDLLDSARPVE